MLTGATVSHYRILDWVGEGGMGVVYRAEDIRLHRNVALKFLPLALSRHPEALERFRREALAASALNHPNICTLYDIGTAPIEPKDLAAANKIDGQVHYLAMEYLEGVNLKSRLAVTPWVEIEELLEIAIQIADALDVAHTKGIIHRDIKPANIFITNRGLAKVLDFGLAKLTSPDMSVTDIQEAETQGRSDLSTASAAIGTTAYMSPEQARGEQVDHRTDLFSFGIVLYEMATNRRPFAGATNALVFDAILNRPVTSPLEHNPKLPPEFERIVLKLLEKDRDLRYQSASDLRTDLKRLRRDSSSGLHASLASTTTRIRTPRVSRRFLRVAAVALLVGLALLAPWRKWIVPPEQPISEGTYTQLTDMSGMELQPTLSPSGDLFAYARNVSGNWDIFLQRVGGSKPINLTADSPADDWQPSFSRDGKFIAFRSERDGGGIYVMGATGESIRRISDLGFTPSWSPDGTEIVISTDMTNDPNGRAGVGQLFIINVQTGAKRLISKGDAVQPCWSPHGPRIAYWGDTGQGSIRNVWTISAAGGTPVPVTDDAAVDWSPVWAPDGKHLYFASDRGGTMNLWRVAINEDTGKTLGEPESVTTPSKFIGQFSVSADGKMIAFTAFERTSNIAKIEFDPAKQKTIGSVQYVTAGTSMYLNPDPSPDDKWLAFRSGGKEDLYISRVDGTEKRSLTDDNAKDRGPKWSPDGKQLAFYSDRNNGKYQIWTIQADGSNLKLLLQSPSDLWWPLWSPDGKQIVASNGEGCFVFDLSTPDRPAKTLPILNDQHDAFIAHSWSADGKWLAGGILSADGTSKAGVVIYSMQSNTFEKITDFGNLVISGSVWWCFPKWLNDSRRVLFQATDGLWIVDRQTKKSTRILTPPAGTNDAIPELSSDNRTIYFTEDSLQSDIWLRSANQH